MGGVDIKKYFGPATYFKSVGDLINVFLPNALLVAGIIAFIAVIVTGIKLMSHAGDGDGKGIEQDKGAFTAALIGLMIIFGSYSIIQLIGYIVGYSFLSPRLK